MTLPKPKAVIFDWNYTLVDLDVEDIKGSVAAIYPEMQEVLEHLYNQGIYLAVISNERGDIIRSAVANMGLEHYFQRVIGIGDAEAGKPSVAPVYAALEGSDVTASPEVWLIGDSHTDMICANNSGCSSILINTRGWSEQMFANSPPDRVFKTHAELREFVIEVFE